MNLIILEVAFPNTRRAGMPRHSKSIPNIPRDKDAIGSPTPSQLLSECPTNVPLFGEQKTFGGRTIRHATKLAKLKGDGEINLDPWVDLLNSEPAVRNDLVVREVRFSAG